MPDPQAPQYIRDAVADFICPTDSIANYQQGYRRHEAEGIRAGRGDDHELMRLVMGCVGAVGDEGVIHADRDAAAAFLEHFQVHAWEKSVGNIRNGHGDLGYSVQAFRRHRQKHAPPSPSSYERGLEDARQVALGAVISGNDQWCAGADHTARKIAERILALKKDPAR